MGRVGARKRSSYEDGATIREGELPDQELRWRERERERKEKGRERHFLIVLHPYIKMFLEAYICKHTHTVYRAEY